MVKPGNIFGAALLMLASCGLAFAQCAGNTCSNTASIAITSPTFAGAQASPYPSPITVSGLTGTLTKVTVTLKGLTYPDPDDIDMLLVGPHGEYFDLFSDAGGFTGVSGINITLDDAGASNLSDNGPLTGGTFKPSCYNDGLSKDTYPTAGSGGSTITINTGQEAHCAVTAGASYAGTGTFASIFNGIDPNGTWKLYIITDSGPDTAGSLSGGWSLTFTTAVNTASTGTSLTSSPNPSFTSGANSSVTLTATVTSNSTPVNAVGTVNFKDGASTIAGCAASPVNSGGVATCTTTFATEGIHQLTAVYSGGTGFATSTSNTVAQSVNNQTTITGNQFCNTGNISGTVGAFSPYPSDIFVSSLGGSVSKVTLKLNNFSSTFPDTLDFLLVGPGGNKFVPWSHVGGGTAVSGLTITLDDGGGAALPDNGPLTTGTFKPAAYGNATGIVAPAPAGPYQTAAPTGSATFQSVFAGVNPNSTWSLYVANQGTDAASIAGGWCLTFTTSSDALTTTTITSTANPSATGSSVTLTAHVKKNADNSNVTSGTVTFTEGNTVLQGPTNLDSNGNVAFTTSSLSEGDHIITATYNGVPGSFNVSNGAIDQRVDNATTVTGLQYCNTGSITIKSNGAAFPYPSHIFVTNAPGTIQKVTVSLKGYTHPNPDDIDMLLVNPSGANLDILSDVGGPNGVNNVNLTLDDAAASFLPDNGQIVSGTFKPTAVNSDSPDNFPSPGPGTPSHFAAPFGSDTLASVFATANANPNGTWSLFIVNDSIGNAGSFGGGWCLNFTVNPPVLAIAKSHTGNFRQGQTGATYSITVTNNGPGSTGGTVTVTDTLPAGLTATAISGTGWTCTLGTLTCTRGDALGAGASFAPITLTVTVANNAGTSVTNSVAASGGGASNTPTATDPTTIDQASDLTIAKSHTGNFTQGQTGAQYSITVTNSGLGATVGTVTVADTLPAGLTATAISGTGWTCTLGTLSCTRNDVLAGGSSYPVITLTVTVANNATSPQVNSATVSGGGELNTANDTATDSTVITAVPDLTISKSHTGNFTQGQTGATYTITVSNAGSGAVVAGNTVTVTDTLPSGLTATAISGTGWTCTLATLTCTRADALAAGASYPAITLTVTVANNAPASATNSVTVSGGGEINTGNDTATDPTTVVGGPDLTISKSHTGNFFQGQTGAQYTITLHNSGAASTSGTVTVVDTLPAGLTATAISGAGWTCTLATLTCTRSDALAGGANYPAITLTVNVANNAGSSVTNTATVSGGGDVNTGNNSANDSTTIGGGADLTITKSHTGNFTQGQTGAQYTITVTNSGAASTSGTVAVVDTLPAGLTATAISGTGWTCTLATLTCTRSDALAGGASYPAITLTVNVANNAGSSVTNTATVSGGNEVNTGNDTANDSTTIGGGADLTITKSHSGNFFQGQTGAQYTITVTNSGAASTSGTVTVVDTLPAGLTATAISGTGWTCTLATLTCTRSDALAGGASYPAITLTVNVANNAGSSVTNTATVSGGNEVNTGNDTANDSTTIGGGADLTITKSHSGNFFQGQTGATYTITVHNSGVASTSGTVTVVDTLPAGLTATAISGTGWTCTLATLTCTRSDALAGGASYPAITLTVNVANNAPGTVDNTATVSGGNEVNTGNDSATDHTTIGGGADLTITKSHSGNFFQGQTGAQYTITVTNSGAASTSGTVTVVDTLPAGLTATAISGTGWTCTLATLTCTRSDTLAGGASYPAITLTVNVAANAPNNVTNTATVSGGNEVNTGNDTANDSTSIGGGADLTITKTHVGDFAQGQTGAAYTITVKNSGAASTSGTVTVVDTLPAGLTATAISGTGWTCTLATLTCTRTDALAAGASYPAITLTVNVANNASSPVVNTATVSGGGESVTNNDTAQDSTNIGQLVTVTVQTSPNGRSFSVDGTTFTSAQTFNWVQGSTHTLATTSPQTVGQDTQFVFLNWSDGGAISHTVTAPNSPTTYTATFDTQFRLTTSVNPAGGGTITANPPSASGFYSAGTSVNLTATPAAGFTFTSWSGPVTNPNSASTSVVINAPTSVVANFTPGPTSLSGTIADRTGDINARVWTFTITNNGPGAAVGTQINGVSLTQTFGAACSPKVTNPASFPLVLGALAPGASQNAQVTLDFTGCQANARFTLNVPLSANGGAATGSIVRYMLYR